MSCVKMAEPIDMHFSMLSPMSPGNMYYMGMYILHRQGHFCSVWPGIIGTGFLQAISVMLEVTVSKH